MINNKSKSTSLLDLLVIITLFLFSINFMQLTNYLIIILFLISLFWMYKKNVNIEVSVEFIVLVICFTSYLLIYNFHFQTSLGNILILWIAPIVGYFIGYHLIIEKSTISFNKIIFTIIWAMFIHGMLNMLLFFYRGENGRLVPDIWRGIGIVATLQGTFFTMIVSLLFYGLFIEREKKNKYMLILAIIFCIYSTIQTASRTLLFIGMITLLLNILLYVYLNKVKIKKIIKIIVISLFLSVSGLIVYQNNILNIKEIYETSPLFTRTNSDYLPEFEKDPRFEMYTFTLNNLLIYPLGGDLLDGPLTYAHNLWLDTARVVGVIPFSLLVLYSLLTFITLIKFLRNRYILESSKYIIFSIYIAMTLNFMVEPILEGVPYMFVLMCIINGATKNLLNKYERKKKNENTMAM